MLLVAALFSIAMGVVLGLLGGGGSILTVPLFVYILGTEPKEAIAASLLVVGTTSAVAAIQHARAGNVRWKIGLTFGVFGMLGAYLGGFSSQWFSGSALLTMFALLMLVAGAAMLRGRKEVEHKGQRSLWKTAVEGIVVGAITGVVGAGGGFLVVPALVLFGGLGMRAAVGTSLLVIALKSFAGLAGHLSHLSLDLNLAFSVTGAAVVGALIGGALATRVDARALRKAFAGFVLLVGSGMVIQELPASLRQLVFVDRWNFAVAGLALGLFVVGFFLWTRKPLGVSSGVSDVCALPTDATAKRSWRLPFLGGIVLGGLVATLAGGGWTATLSLGSFDTLFAGSFAIQAAVLVVGGMLLGFGARLGGGCTSGHGIVGVALLTPSSLLATGAFMAGGFATTALLFQAIGG